MADLGTYTTQCPACGTDVTLPVTFTLESDDETRARNEVRVAVKADTAPLEAHYRATHLG